MKNIGVVGAGHLGKIHIRLIKEIEGYNLVGVFDTDKENLTLTCKEYNTRAFESLQELIDNVEIVDVVTPTLSHFKVASKAIKNCKHVFIEKPITNTAKEAMSLMLLSQESGSKIQVGHVERFNPAFSSALPYFDAPKFIETHRLAQFNPRGTDVPVVLDLMIHDIDIVLSVVKSNVRKISASGVSVMSDTPDIANARLEFDNGCVANLTASRMSLKNMRKSRFFQKNAYISVDFLEKKTEIIQMEDLVGEADPFDIILETKNSKKKIIVQQPDIIEGNAIKDELTSFLDSILSDTTPKVSAEDGYNALKVATEIVEKINQSHSI